MKTSTSKFKAEYHSCGNSVYIYSDANKKFNPDTDGEFQPSKQPCNRCQAHSNNVQYTRYDKININRIIFRETVCDKCEYKEEEE